MRRSTALAAVALAALMLAGQAVAAPSPPIRVDDDGAQCAAAPFQRIQDAVTAAGPGATVLVCPGTYPEQVVVPAGKDGLTLRSQVPLQAIIQAPPTIAADLVNSKAILRITVSKDVSVVAFTITGPGPGPCDSIRYGVRVDGNGSANILRNHITEIRDTPFSGCQNGVAILVGRQFEDQVGSARIVGNTIDRYQKNGPTIDNAGSSAYVSGNRITGIGPTPVIAQNGIQISRGAVAEVRGNTVQDNTYTLAPAFGSSGILLFEAGSGTEVAKNTVRRNDDNIGVYSTTGSRIASNRVTDSTFFDGIFVDATSTANRIVDNFLRGNAEHDCHDDSVGVGTAGTANFWIDNDGVTENRPGLCRGGEDEDEDEGDEDDEHEGDED